LKLFVIQIAIFNSLAIEILKGSPHNLMLHGKLMILKDAGICNPPFLIDRASITNMLVILVDTWLAKSIAKNGWIALNSRAYSEIFMESTFTFYLAWFKFQALGRVLTYLPHIFHANSLLGLIRLNRLSTYRNLLGNELLTSCRHIMVADLIIDIAEFTGTSMPLISMTTRLV
jgi:hypothetical protein